MPIIRNPFRKQDENARPTIITSNDAQKTTGTSPVKAADIKEEQKQPVEYQLSGTQYPHTYISK